MHKQSTAEELLVRGIENNDLTLSDLKALIAYTQEKKSLEENANNSSFNSIKED